LRKERPALPGRGISEQSQGRCFRLESIRRERKRSCACRSFTEKEEPGRREAAAPPLKPEAEALAAGTANPIPQSEEEGKEKSKPVTEEPLQKIEVVSKLPEAPPAEPTHVSESKKALSMKKVGIEISNGNGVNQMARKVGDY